MPSVEILQQTNKTYYCQIVTYAKNDFQLEFLRLNRSDLKEVSEQFSSGWNLDSPLSLFFWQHTCIWGLFAQGAGTHYHVSHSDSFHTAYVPTPSFYPLNKIHQMPSRAWSEYAKRAPDMLVIPHRTGREKKEETALHFPVLFQECSPPPPPLFSQRTDKKPWLLLTAPGFSTTRKGRGREQREGERRKKPFRRREA